MVCKIYTNFNQISPLDSTWAGIHKTCRDEILSQVLSFDLKSETVFGLKLVAIHRIVETNFSLRFGLKLKTGT